MDMNFSAGDFLRVNHRMSSSYPDPIMMVILKLSLLAEFSYPKLNPT